MSHDPAAPDQRPTNEHPTVTATLTDPLGSAGWVDDDEEAELDQEEWVSQTARGIRLGAPVAALLAVMLIGGGFWAGAALEKSHAGSGTSSLAGLAARLRSAAGAGATGASGSSRFGGFGGLGRVGGGSAATGTIAAVDGDTLYVTSAGGGTVKVTLNRSTTITRDADATAIDLRPGDTVVVQGATGSSGTVTASSVSATAPGVSSGFAALFGGQGTGTGGGGSSSNTTTTPALFGSGG